MVACNLGCVPAAVTLKTLYFGYHSVRPAPDLATFGVRYKPPLYHRQVVGITTGLCAIGLCVGLFYLRRVYLARTSSDAV
ncbi:MAG: hypothetical protein AAF965_14165 [Pseudomonadota bacterium]